MAIWYLILAHLAIILIADIVYLRLEFYENLSFLPDDIPADNEKIIFWHKGTQIIMTKGQKDEWDTLMPGDKALLMKEIKKAQYKRQLSQEELAVAGSMKKMSNKPEERQAWLKS